MKGGRSRPCFQRCCTCTHVLPRFLKIDTYSLVSRLIASLSATNYSAITGPLAGVELHSVGVRGGGSEVVEFPELLDEEEDPLLPPDPSVIPPPPPVIPPPPALAPAPAPPPPIAAAPAPPVPKIGRAHV